MDLLAPITTKPWGSGHYDLSKEAAPGKDMVDSQHLFNEPKYVRMDDGGLHTLESNGLEIKEGVYY
jgi:adenylylsulfate reductase subunit B